LSYAVQGWPLNIIQGKDYIEVRPEGVGKGKMVGHLLNKMRVDGNPADFVLCIGDDVADELMFEQLKKMVAHQELPKGELDSLGVDGIAVWPSNAPSCLAEKVFTCTVGQKPSKADFFVDDYTDVIALLKSLKVVATKVLAWLAGSPPRFNSSCCVCVVS
jgi:trehalose 6-phosphate synthase/phosphatase